MPLRHSYTSLHWWILIVLHWLNLGPKNFIVKSKRLLREIKNIVKAKKINISFLVLASTNLLFHFIILFSPPSPEKCNFDINESLGGIFHELRNHRIKNVLKLKDDTIKHLSILCRDIYAFLYIGYSKYSSYLDSNVCDVFCRSIIILINRFQPSNVIMSMRN